MNLIACRAALDTSSSHASFAVATVDGELLVDIHDAPIGRRSAAVLPRLLTALGEAGIDLNQIREWTVGMGPGSFTGIRLGAALVKGICAGTGARHRGLPSSLAMAVAAPATGETVATLHDGRRNEVIVSLYRRAGDGWQPANEPPAVMAIDQLPQALPAATTIVILREDGARNLLPAEFQDRVQVLPWLDARGLLAPHGWPWGTADNETEAAAEPIYVRPAVFVPPTAPTTHPMVRRLLDRGNQS